MKQYKLVSSTRISGTGELSTSNRRFKTIVKDSGIMPPKHGKAGKSYQAKQKLESLFNN